MKKMTPKNDYGARRSMEQLSDTIADLLYNVIKNGSISFENGRSVKICIVVYDKDFLYVILCAAAGRFHPFTPDQYFICARPALRNLIMCMIFRLIFIGISKKYFWRNVQKIPFGIRFVRLPGSCIFSGVLVEQSIILGNVHKKCIKIIRKSRG